MEELSIWTITENPSDYPGMFVARRHQVDRRGPSPTPDVILADDLDLLRDEFFARGMAQIPRSAEDEPQIVESWI